MEGFGLLVGHLIGDFILQNDWQAKNKANPYPGPRPHTQRSWIGIVGHELSAAEHKALEECRAWAEAYSAWWRGNLACTVHCLLYTAAVWLCSCWWLPWWGLVAVFATHWPIDRFRLAAKLMQNVSGQSVFASKEHPMYPWSIVSVDQTMHLMVLFAIGMVR